MSRHSVENHLRLSIKDYDVQIKRLVPYYDEFMNYGMDLLKTFIPENAFVVDLGGGTGRLSQAILEKLPNAHVQLLDIDPVTLKQAAQRFEKKPGNIELKEGSFFEPLPLSDAIVASLSLHHVPQKVEKIKVYKNVHKALKSSGLFLIMDSSVSSHPRISTITLDIWKKHMASQGMTLEEAQDHLDSWKKEEFYFSIEEEFDALKQAGFSNPECFWRKGPMAIYGALKT